MRADYPCNDLIRVVDASHRVPRFDQVDGTVEDLRLPPNVAGVGEVVAGLSMAGGLLVGVAVASSPSGVVRVASVQGAAV